MVCQGAQTILDIDNVNLLSFPPEGVQMMAETIRTIRRTGKEV